MARAPYSKLLRVGIEIAAFGAGLAILGFLGGALWSYWRIDQSPVPTPADLSEGPGFAGMAVAAGAFIVALGAVVIVLALVLRERGRSEINFF